ncbi:DNA phosphorothioation-dependent restriction protein DptG [Pontibacterium sp.]|uniref:DNA phosphorothioation-dependent restriction protein DptG n=1 Tax=Pontibacterium sp. TaxID=2036026 RepID=UPI003519D077
MNTSVLKETLKPENSNRLNSYFPARTNDSAEAYDWNIAKAIFVRDLYRRQPVAGGMEAFKAEAKNEFLQLLDDEDFWPHLEAMYFGEESIYRLTPESLLFELDDLKDSASKHRLGRMFSSLLQGTYMEVSHCGSSHFLDKKMINALQSKGLRSLDKTKHRPGAGERPWLPFLSEAFQQDAKFLASKPDYMLEQLEPFLRLYAYLYTAQLSLNIHGWASGEPKARPLYFMMEHEVASKERSQLTQYGHKKVLERLKDLFPYLVVNEALQQVNEHRNERLRPLWYLNQKLIDTDAAKLRLFAFAFAQEREYEMPDGNDFDDAASWLNQILKLYCMQFEKGRTRASANNKFVKYTEEFLCSTFVRSRGRSGKVLVMNQDYLSLLTNLAIGDNDKLRFHELLTAFNSRGVFFDKQSQQALIEFFERMGNVERMSDSGDAVYVRKTV